MEEQEGCGIAENPAVKIYDESFFKTYYRYTDMGDDADIACLMCAVSVI